MLFLFLAACAPEPDPEGTVEDECFDGEDNDLDGEIDCDDAGCRDLAECGSANTVLFINEFMASNESTIGVDVGDGVDFPDWIEIYNPNDEDVDLGGWYLTDDLSNPQKHLMPAGVIVPAGGFTLLWADDDEEDEGSDHLGFHLAVEGEAVGIYRPNGSPADTLTYEAQVPDISAARITDGGDEWELTDEPTPGESNG